MTVQNGVQSFEENTLSKKQFNTQINNERNKVACLFAG